MKRLWVAAALVAVVVAFYWLDLGQYLSVAYFKSQQQLIAAYRDAYPWQSAAIYFGAYVLVTGLSLPGAAIMTLAGGAVFGLLEGTLLVSFASSLGATVAFLVARVLLRDLVQSRLGSHLRAVNEGMARDGPLYLFALRLVPAFPFFAINLVLGLTAMRPWTFYWVSQLGMLPGTLVYVNAGTQLATVDSVGAILSPGLLASFALLAVFPWVARRVVTRLSARRRLRRYPRPRRFDRNLVVIGAGSAGLVSAYVAAAVRAKVSLIERHRMGGDCLNTGCVPSKALIRTTRLLAELRRAEALGLRSASAEVDFAQVMERVQRVIGQVAPHDSAERYRGLGVDVIQGEARITSPYTVEVGGRVLTTRSIVIASGAAPRVPSIPGIEAMSYWTSDTVWSLRELPPRLLVLGGGPVGCELAQCFQRLGSRVTLVQRGPRLLSREDPELSELLAERFRSEGIELRLGHRSLEFRLQDGQRRLLAEHAGEQVEIELDALLLALGRTANTRDLGLEPLGVALSPEGTIQVDEQLQTSLPNVYACGDVAGPYQFTHTAAHQAWYATVNALLGGLKRFRVDYSVIPWTTFTEPEIARVGLSETEATERGIPFEVTRFDLAELDRAIADEAACGLVKVLTVPRRDKILGAAIAGEHAGELLPEFIAAMRNGYGLNRILGTIHVYPTFSEANKHAAGVWRRAHQPQRVLRWVERLQRWRRGA